MEKTKRQKLESAGWQVGDTADFLQLSSEEVAFMEMKLFLNNQLKELRQSETLSQRNLPQKLNFLQPRVAKMEANDSSVPIDLMVRTLLALGATREDGRCGKCNGESRRNFFELPVNFVSIRI